MAATANCGNAASCPFHSRAYRSRNHSPFTARNATSHISIESARPSALASLAQSKAPEAVRGKRKRRVHPLRKESL